MLSPGITKFEFEKENEMNSGSCSEMTPSCKWPIADRWCWSPFVRKYQKTSNYAPFPGHRIIIPLLCVGYKMIYMYNGYIQTMIQCFNNGYYYTLESLSQFWLATSTQLILAGCVSVTSYLQTIVFIHLEVTSYLQTIVSCMKKWRHLTRLTAVWVILSWRSRHQGLPRYQQKTWTSFLMIKM